MSPAQGSTDTSLDAADSGADDDFGSGDVGATQASCKTYIEIALVDESGDAVSKGTYRLKLTDGSVREGQVPSDGRIRVDSIPHGTCEFTLLPMLDFGTPEDEIKRSWTWEARSGNRPDFSPSRTAGSSDGANAPTDSEADAPSDDTTDEED